MASGKPGAVQHRFSDSRGTQSIPTAVLSNWLIAQNGGTLHTHDAKDTASGNEDLAGIKRFSPGWLRRRTANLHIVR
jgi:hypothetical protein